MIKHYESESLGSFDYDDEIFEIAKDIFDTDFLHLKNGYKGPNVLGNMTKELERTNRYTK